MGKIYKLLDYNIRKNKMNTRILKEVKEIISPIKEEIQEEKKVIVDKKTKQYSLKIPKSLALKAGLKEDTVFQIVFNPDEKTIEKITKSKFIIFQK